MTGAVLAGGRGRRMGGASKPAALLGGRPLIAYPLAALAEVCERVAVVCKRETRLPELAGQVERWDEPDEPRHPAAGVVHALERDGAAVLVCAADMPFVQPVQLRQLLAAADAAPAATAVVAEAAGVLQPALGVFRAPALPVLRAAGTARLTDTVQALAPRRVPVSAHAATSVDTPQDLTAAEAELALG